MKRNILPFWVLGTAAIVFAVVAFGTGTGTGDGGTADDDVFLGEVDQ